MILTGDWAPGNKIVKTSLVLSRGVLANLEGPILPRDHSFVTVPKAGPSLFSCDLPNETGQFFFALANNHLMDYGIPGLEATLKLLDKKGFRACGAGKDVYDARRPIIAQDNGVKVGIIACCEAQFGVAIYPCIRKGTSDNFISVEKASRRCSFIYASVYRCNSAGVAEFGPWIYRAIRNLRETVDAVIVSVHAAVEDSPWPSPYIRALYRSFVDAGASVVHGHHSHVPQGYEAYGDGVIFYGMGNFAVDPDKWRDYPNGM